MKRIFTNKKLVQHLVIWCIGFFAFMWVIVRSGQSPKRLAYPCQQAAFPFASAWFLVTAGFFSGIFNAKNKRKMLYILVLGFIIFVGVGIYYLKKRFPAPPDVVAPQVWRMDNPISSIFLIDSIKEENKSLNNPLNQDIPNEYLYDRPVEELLDVMKNNGTNLYKTGNAEGIVPKDATVIIKGNFQWDYRLGTNTDRIKGLIMALLDHPDGFSGEVLVCENTQYEGKGIGDNTNNSKDKNQSIIDVTNAFKTKGYKVDLVDWGNLNEIHVQEYTEGDSASGYIYDRDTKISYPKFTSPYGTKVSLKHGIWDQEHSAYDRSKLVIVNFPVLKAHGIMGATIAIKNWIGVISLANLEERFGDYDKMHSEYFFSEYALPARAMAQTFPDLTILDATWTAYGNNYADWYGNRVNTGMLLASTDPVAISWYAAKHILTPVAAKPKASDPDGNGAYGRIFNHFVNYLRDSTTHSVTKDPTKISIITN